MKTLIISDYDCGYRFSVAKLEDGKMMMLCDDARMDMENDDQDKYRWWKVYYDIDDLSAELKASLANYDNVIICADGGIRLITKEELDIIKN